MAKSKFSDQVIAVFGLTMFLYLLSSSPCWSFMKFLCHAVFWPLGFLWNDVGPTPYLFRKKMIGLQITGTILITTAAVGLNTYAGIACYLILSIVALMVRAKEPGLLRYGHQKWKSNYRKDEALGLQT